MEYWAAFQGYPDDSLFEENGGCQVMAEWSAIEENKLFEDAKLGFDSSSLNIFKNVASRLPWKPVNDVKIHYQWGIPWTEEKHQ